MMAILFIFPSLAAAQTDITLTSVNVQLWPEYDQPSMLVIYDFELTPETTLPAKVDIRIPKDANITAVAFQDGSDLKNTEFSGPVEDGNWLIIIPNTAITNVSIYTEEDLIIQRNLCDLLGPLLSFLEFWL
jgi:hypothetical protein